MTLSVGLGRITNDPEASIRTRLALGKLATPGLLVTDKGLTIDTNGRMVLRLSSGLSESDSGLAVKVAPGGGITSGADGLALDAHSGDLTVENLTVNHTAHVLETLTVDVSITSPALNSGAIVNSGNINTASLDVVGNASVGGTLTVATLSPSTLSVSGNASVGGILTVAGNEVIGGSLAASSATIAGSISGASIGASSATISGAITAGSAAISGNETVGGTLGVTGALSAASAAISGNLTAATATIGATQLTALGIISNLVNFASLGVSGSASVGGVLSAASASVSGNATVSGLLTASTLSAGPSGCSTLAIGSGTTMLKVLSFLTSIYVNPVAEGSQDDYIFCSGVLIGDLAICSPTTLPGVPFLSWSAMVYNTDYVVIRTSRGITGGSAATHDFRITIIRFA